MKKKAWVIKLFDKTQKFNGCYVDKYEEVYVKDINKACLYDTRKEAKHGGHENGERPVKVIVETKIKEVK